jgi:ankyrin repeat protein
MNPRNVVAGALFLVVFLGPVAMSHGRSMEKVEPKPAIAKAIEEGDDAEAGRILGEYELRQCYFGQSPATLAAEYGRLGILKKILERGASIEGTECWSGTPLLEAAGQGHVEVVRYLLSKGATPNPSVKSRRTPLLAAIEDPLFFHAKQEGSKETLKIVLLLLDAGADPNASDQLERTPLILAVRNADARLARLLLSHGADPNVKGSRGKSALDLAKADRLDYIASLLEGKPPGKSEGGNTVLLNAVKGNNLAEVTRLLGGGADVNARDDGGSPPLIHAASLGHSAIAEALIAKEADVNIRNGKNGTALIYASAGGITKLVEALLEKGAEVDAKDHAGNTAIGYAVYQDKAPCVALLAASKADLEMSDEEGGTLLMGASAKGFTSVVKALLRGGAKVDAADREGRTALMAAAEEGRKDVVELLLAGGAGTGRKDKDGNDALQVAIKANHPAIVKILMAKSPAPGLPVLRGALGNCDAGLVETLLSKGVAPNAGPGENPLLLAAVGTCGNKVLLARRMVEAGARVNDRDLRGKTPLMEAAQGSGADSTEVVTYLLTRGADPNARDEKGLTPWRIAMLSGHNATVKALEQGGAAAEYGSLAWGGIFFGGGGGPSSVAIDTPNAWTALWKTMGKGAEAPAIDFDRYVAAFVFLGVIDGYETEEVIFGTPERQDDTLVIPWSTGAYVIYDISSTSPYGVKIFDRRGAKRVLFKGSRSGP